MTPISLIIVEDDAELRQSLTEYFSGCFEFFVPATYDSIEAFTKDKSDHKPDLILLDLVLPGKSGIQGIPIIKQKYPDVSIIVNSVLEDTTSIFSALKHGAIGYITKATRLDQLKLTLVNAYNGMSVMSQDIAAQVIDYFKRGNELEEKLTKREIQVAESLKMGLSYKVIAMQQGVSIDAIRFHVRNIYKKLEINSKGELINLMTRG